MRKTLATLALFLVSQTTYGQKYTCDNIENLSLDVGLVEKTREPIENLIQNNLIGQRILVSKDEKRLYVFNGDILLRAYDVAFGKKSFGPKTFEGDFKTPEGKYSIDYKNKDSNYYLSLHISYPNREDLQRNKKINQTQKTDIGLGGEIMIHGFPNDLELRKWIERVHPYVNWTRGCIAVRNAEIEELFTIIPVGTSIEICPAQKRTYRFNPLNFL